MIRNIVVGCTIAFTIFSAQLVFARGQGTRSRFRDSETINLEIAGLKTPLSAAVAESVLAQSEGVYSANVHYQSERGTLEFGAKADLLTILENLAYSTPYRARLLPPNTKTAAFQIPDLRTREYGDRVNEVIEQLEGITGGTIRAGFVAVDYDSRVIDAESIAEAIAAKTDLEASVISIPASVSIEPEHTAKVAIRMPGVNSYRAAAELADSINLEGIVGGSFDPETETVTVNYSIEMLTSLDLQTLLAELIDGEASIVSLDKSDKPPWLNTKGWFVIIVSILALALMLSGFVIIRQLRKGRKRAKSSL